MTEKKILLKDGLVVTPTKVVQANIAICNGKIEFPKGQNNFDEVIDIAGKYLVPGFVDIHFHGYNLFDFVAGQYSPKTDTYDNSQSAYYQGFDTLRKKLAEFGVTGFYLSSFAAPIETLKYCFRQLCDYMNKPDDATLGARLLGGGLEGTFINPNMAGAQNPELIFAPTPDIFDSIEDHGSIKLANVVPDAGKKSVQLTEYLTKKGVIVGLGHTNATCNQVADAVKAGLKYCIHFTNGPTGGSYKPFDGGGAIEAVLKFDEIYAEQICDGIHVNPAYVRDIITRKGVDKIIGVTDCIHVVGSDLKEFTVGGIKGKVSEDGRYLHVADKPNTLFSSNLTMNRGFTNVLNWLTSDMRGIWNRKHKAWEFDKAIVSTAKIFATNPCALTKLTEKGIGSIVNGAAADLCVLNITGSAGNYQLTVDSTIVNGNMVYSAK